MKKLFSEIKFSTLAVLLVVSFSGCVGNQPRVDYPIYTPTQKVEIKHDDIIKVSKGRLEFKGNSILDEDGDIDMAFNINGKLFYFVTNELSSLATYTLKDEQGKEIKKFEGQSIQLVKDENNLPIVMVQLTPIKIYDNIYKFDGNEVKLVNKNFPMRYHEIYAAGHQIIPKISEDGSFISEYYSFESVTTNANKTLHVLHPHSFLGMQKVNSFRIIGSAGPNIIYTHNDQNDDLALEIYNVKTGEQKVLLKGKNRIQILYSGDKFILRILSNPELSLESSIFQNDVVSKYDNESSTFIDLATLNEVKINTNDFNKLVLESGYAGLGGGYIREWFLTFSLSTLHDVIKKRNGSILF